MIHFMANFCYKQKDIGRSIFLGVDPEEKAELIEFLFSVAPSSSYAHPIQPMSYKLSLWVSSLNIALLLFFQMFVEVVHNCINGLKDASTEQDW